MVIEFDIPIKTASLANLRLHWAAKARLVSKQREAARMLTRNALNGTLIPKRVRVTMERRAARRGNLLDTDNLASALKPTRDGIADALGIDDGDERTDWVCEQSRGHQDWSVMVKIEEVR